MTAAMVLVLAVAKTTTMMRPMVHETSLRTGSQRGREKNSAIEIVNPQAACTPLSPDRSRLIPLTLDYTRLAHSKRETVHRLHETG